MRLPPIAIGGRMQVGKTTCAEHLVTRYGYVRYALADPIKEIARSGFDWDGLKDQRGRLLLQELGSTGRNYDPELWLRRFEEWSSTRAGDVPVVIDDLRLLNEADYFKCRGFLTVLLLRPGHSAGEASLTLREHETETELERAELDLVIVNSGTLADLHRTLDRALAGHAARPGRGPARGSG